MASAISTRVAAPPYRAWATRIRTCSRRSTRRCDRVAYAHSSFFTTDVAEALADTLVATAPPGLEHVYLVSGGSEAIEAALKLARQYAVEIGEPQRSVFIARRQSYHGNTLGALAVGGNEWRRREFEPLLIACRARIAVLSNTVSGAAANRRTPTRTG